MLRIALYSLAVMVTLGPHAAAAERQPIDVQVLGPQVGESVPDFSLLDQNGDPRTLDSILGPRGALILFHRSADW